MRHKAKAKAKDWTGKAKAKDTKKFSDKAKAKDSSVKDKDKAKDLPVMTRTDEDILETCKNSSTSLSFIHQNMVTPATSVHNLKYYNRLVSLSSNQ